MSNKRTKPKPNAKRLINKQNQPKPFFGIKQYWTTLFKYFRREHYPTLIGQEAKSRYKIFRELKSISTAKKKQIGNKIIRSYSVKLAYVNFLEDRLHEVREFLYRFASIAFFFFIGLAAHKYLGYKTLGGITPLSYVIRFAPTILILFIIRNIFGAISRRITFGQRLLLLTFSLIITLIYMGSTYTAYRVLFFGVLGFLVITIVSIAIDTIILLWAERYVNQNHPQAIVTHNLLLVLSGIEKEDKRLSELEFRKWCAKRLEYAATAIEVHIQRRLRTSDRLLNDWFSERTYQIACAIRDKKKWVYMQKPDTAEKLTTSLAKFLVNFLSNEWDSLEKIDVPMKSWRDDWKAQLILAVRTLVVGFLPITILYATQFFRLVAQPFDEYVVSIAMFWALLNLLWAIDPTLRDKIGTLKDATGFISAKSK
jgi:hypothetical protein